MVDVKSEDINVVVMDLPIGLKEQVINNHDGSYTILLNSRYNAETIEKAKQHAVDHIKNEDFQKDNVQDIEAAAHGKVVNYAEAAPPPVKKKKRRRRTKLHKYYEEKAAFMEEFFTPERRWQIAEEQHLYGGL